MEGWYFSQQQKVGTVVLMALLALAILGWWGWQRQAAKAPLAFAVADSLYQPPAFDEPSPRVDINLADSAAWEALYGIGPVLSRRIVRYRARLGGFDSVGQLARVYGLPPKTLEALRPRLFVNPLTRQELAQTDRPSPTPQRDYPRLEINQASAADFARLPGIGEVLSQRIVNFRNAKGGFRAVADISRVYNLPPETFQRISPYLYLAKAPSSSPRSPATVPPEQQVNLNQADAAALARIPGVEAELAQRILKYRRLLGHYAFVDQLRAVYGLSSGQYERMLPYLTVGDLSRYPKKPLNQATARELAFLPGVDEYQAKRLIATREKLGFFRDWQAVDRTPGLSAEAMRQLQAYYAL